MFSVFTSTLTPLLTMFFCIVIGYALKKANLLPDNANVVLSKLETYVLLPAVNITSFMTYCNVQSLVAHRYLVLTSVILIAVAVGLSYPLSKIFHKDGYQRNIYKYAMTFGNYGFLGNAIVPVILGEEALFTYLLFTMPLSAVCHTWGVSQLIPKGKQKGAALKRLLNPSMISISVGIILGLTGAKAIMPSFLTMALSNLKACMGPVAMVLTGFVVAKYNLGSLLKMPRVYLASLFRLIILPATYIAALLLLKVDKSIVIMALFAFATPLGLNTVVFPSAHGADPSTGASMALISHTLGIFTIPLLYAVVSYLL